MIKILKFFLLIILVLCISSSCGYKHNIPLTTQNDVVQLYNNNDYVFNNAVDVIFKDDFHKDIMGYYFFYDGESISVYYENNPIEYHLPTDIHSAILDCFILMEEIVDKSYKHQEYSLLIVLDNDCQGLNFYINDEIIHYSYCLTYATYPDICLETSPSWTYKINDNWFYRGWGQV